MKNIMLALLISLFSISAFATSAESFYSKSYIATDADRDGAIALTLTINRNGSWASTDMFDFSTRMGDSIKIEKIEDSIEMLALYQGDEIKDMYMIIDGELIVPNAFAYKLKEIEVE